MNKELIKLEVTLDSLDQDYFTDKNRTVAFYYQPAFDNKDSYKPFGYYTHLFNIKKGTTTEDFFETEDEIKEYIQKNGLILSPRLTVEKELICECFEYFAKLFPNQKQMLENKKKDQLQQSNHAGWEYCFIYNVGKIYFNKFYSDRNFSHIKYFINRINKFFAKFNKKFAEYYSISENKDMSDLLETIIGDEIVDLTVNNSLFTSLDAPTKQKILAIIF